MFVPRMARNLPSHPALARHRLSDRVPDSRTGTPRCVRTSTSLRGRRGAPPRRPERIPDWTRRVCRNCRRHRASPSAHLRPRRREPPPCHAADALRRPRRHAVCSVPLHPSYSPTAARGSMVTPAMRCTEVLNRTTCAAAANAASAAVASPTVGIEAQIRCRIRPGARRIRSDRWREWITTGSSA